LSSFWGLSSIIDLNLSWATWKLPLAMVLFGLAIAALGRALRHGRMSACVVATFSLVAGLLLWRRADFGIFKVVLYLQPFLAAFLAAELTPIIKQVGVKVAAPIGSWLVRRGRRPSVSAPQLLAAAVCAIAALTAITQLTTLAQYRQI